MFGVLDLDIHMIMEFLNMNNFGSSAIVDDMKKHSGWDHGRVVIMGHNIIRDPLTTKIISILGKGKAPIT